MSCRFKLKVIVLGSSSSGKKYFFENCSQISNYGYERSYWGVGVSINIAQSTVENGDYVTMSIWDINLSERFRFLCTSYFKGAAGCLLFCDIGENNLLNNLDYWVNNIREFAENILIYLVGDTSLSNDRLNYREINHFIEINNLEGYFLIPNQLNLIIDELNRRILET